MTSTTDQRRKAIEQAIGNNRLSGYTPSDFGHSVFEQWINGAWSTDEAVLLVKQHYRENRQPDSDNAAAENAMGLTDSGQLHKAEADITTLRMADLEIDPV